MPQLASIKVDSASLADVQLMLKNIKNGYPKAMSRAINKGLATARVEARKKVQEEVTASAKYVNRAFVENKATYSKLAGALVAAGIPISLIAYSTRQTKKGVTVKVNKTGQRDLLPHAFIASMRNVSKSGEESEHKGVFWRKYSGPRQPNPRWMSMQHKRFPYSALPAKFRLPVEQKFGPSIPAIFERGPILDHVEKQAAIAAMDELSRQVDLLLK